ncbi:MAG: beta family protein [Xanthobacteraceae bacterium]|nr:beta family protein [Xanthobacteraceae bacterium]
MLTTKHLYRPQLRSKSGEAAALNHLSIPAKSRLAPVINMVAKPPGSFAQDVSASWAGRAMALDGTYNVGATSTTAWFNNMLGTIGAGGVKAIPSIEYGEVGPYLHAVKAMVGAFAPGLVLKVGLADLKHAASYAAAQGWPTREIDLIVDLKEVHGYDQSLLHPMVSSAMGTYVAPGVWRSVTLSASSAPKDHGGLPAGRSVVPRRCWDVWNATAKLVPYTLDFSDYGTATPNLADPPGMAMTKATVSVRYTVDKDWIIRKGQPTSGKTGVVMSTQYRAHAQALATEAQFGGLPMCWGDDRILAIGGGTTTPGNRTTWASIGASRHLSYVAAMLP